MIPEARGPPVSASGASLPSLDTGWIAGEERPARRRSLYSVYRERCGQIQSTALRIGSRNHRNSLSAARISLSYNADQMGRFILLSTHGEAMGPVARSS